MSSLHDGVMCTGLPAKSLACKCAGPLLPAAAPFLPAEPWLLQYCLRTRAVGRSTMLTQQHTSSTMTFSSEPDWRYWKLPLAS